MVENLSATLINVYAPNSPSEQKLVWEEISKLRGSFSSPWIMGGDFNSIRGRSERSNCIGLLCGMKEFNSFIEECELLDLPLSGKKFTWFGPNNKMSRLDHFFVDAFWMVRYHDLLQLGLGRSVSDRIPILLFNSSVDWGLRPFKCFNAWLDQEECKKIIEEVWERMRGDNSNMISKLRRVKTVLKKWNDSNRGSMDNKIKGIEKKISAWDDIGCCRKLNEVELEEVR